MSSAGQNRHLLAILLLAPTFLVGQSAVTHSARFDLRQGAPVVHVFLNHRGPFTFVVDTATTGPVIISPGLASKIGLKTEGKKTLTDLQGLSARRFDTVTIDSVQIAGVEFNSVTAIVNQLPGTASHDDGIIGIGLLRDQLVTLDFPHRALRLTSGALSQANDASVLSCRSANGVPTIQLRFQGHAVEGVIDTGAPGLTIPQSLASRLTFLGPPGETAVNETQVGEIQVMLRRMAGEIQFATFRFDRPYIEIAPGASPVDLGVKTFLDFSLTFDEHNQLVRIWSKKSKHTLRHATEHDDEQLPADRLQRTVMRTN